MTLSEYLEINDLSIRGFALPLGLSHSTVAAVCRGKRCSKRNAQRISDATGGIVTVEFLLSQEPWKAIYRSV